MKIAAVADIHLGEKNRGEWAAHFKKISEKADVVVICGDLTDNGNIHKAELLKEEFQSCSIPVVAVLGNHDYEKNNEEKIKSILQGKHVHILDGDSVIIKDVGFAGVKGFGGGVDKYMLALFGEGKMKSYVQEAVEEALKLDRALTSLEKREGIKKIALLHYSPVKATVVGEPEQIFPFLGSSRLADPINRRQVVAAFHGHAHLRTLEGTTSRGVKVFNVSKTILEKSGFNPPVYIFEVQ
jgi:Icc-related predicted phosphoesterase